MYIIIMSFKQEIKDLFIAELLNTPQYQIILNIKQLIIDEINRPNIQEFIIYTHNNMFTQEDIQIIPMVSYLAFGFKFIVTMDSPNIIIDMKNFIS